MKSEVHIMGEKGLDFKHKEVININDGKRLGYVQDVTADLQTGIITSIIVPILFPLAISTTSFVCKSDKFMLPPYFILFFNTSFQYFNCILFNSRNLSLTNSKFTSNFHLCFTHKKSFF